MYRFKLRKIFLTIVVVFGIFSKSANSILSENAPKTYEITPLYQEKIAPQTQVSNEKASTQKLEQQSITKKSNDKKEKQKQVIQEDYRTEITVTAKRARIEPVLSEASKPMLSEAIKNLEKTIVEDSYYQFVSSNPENDFITLSALDFIVTKSEKKLTKMVSESEIIPEQAKCQTTYEMCNRQLVASISDRLEKMNFIKLSQQALGTNLKYPYFEVDMASPLTNTDIIFAFNDLKSTDSNITNYYLRPSDFSNLIRNILKNKKSIFTEPSSEFISNFKILQSQLSIYELSDREFFSNVTQNKESNLTTDMTEKMMSQIDQFVEFVEQEKIIIDNQIVSNTSSTSITLKQSIEQIKQEASELRNLYDLIGDYTKDEIDASQKDNNLLKKFSEWLNNNTGFFNKINSLQFSDDIMTEENIILISELQTELREQRQSGILLSNEILNSKEGIQSFNGKLPELADLNAQLKETQKLFLYQSLDLILIETTERLNEILTTLSSQNIDALKQPINVNTLQFFPSLVPENRAMQEIITYIVSKNSGENNSPNITLSDAGINLDNNGFYKYEIDRLKKNSQTPEQHALQILDNFNYHLQ